MEDAAEQHLGEDGFSCSVSREDVQRTEELLLITVSQVWQNQE
jgi:hypothetical protein